MREGKSRSRANAEADLRIARAVFGRLLGLGRTDVLGTVGALVRPRTTRPWPISSFDEPNLGVLVKEVFDPEASGGLQRRHVQRARPSCAGRRDRLSIDAWRILQGIEHDLAAFDLKVEEDQDRPRCRNARSPDSRLRRFQRRCGRIHDAASVRRGDSSTSACTV